MGLNINTLLNFFCGVAASEGAEEKMEVGIGLFDTWKKGIIASSENKLDDAAEKTFDIAIRDFYVKKYPLADNPVD